RADLRRDGGDASPIRTLPPVLVVELFAEVAQFDDAAIRLRPDGDGLRDIAQAAESAEQDGHARDVLGTVPSLNEASVDDRWIRLSAIEASAGGPITERHGDGRGIASVVALVARLRISGEMIDGVLLALRPQALTTNVGSQGREHLHAGVGQDEK